MDVMSLHFRTLRYLGLWCGPNGQHWLVKYVWRPFVVGITLLFTISLLAATVIHRDNVQDLTQCIFISLTYVGLCLRLLNFLWRQDTVNELLNEFRGEICRPRNDEEADIMAKNKKLIYTIFYLHMGIGQFTGLAFLSLPIITIVRGKDELDFPVKIYQICCKENIICYSFVYVFEILGVVIGILANVTLETMLASFVLLTCGQIDLCCHRFISSSSNEIQRSIKECVVHQILIWRITRKLESFLMRIAVPLVLFGLITLCTCIYNISKTKFGDPESFPFLMYLWSKLIQLLCYCWFGNELKLKSTKMCETVYKRDWTSLKPLDRKSLYFIMLSCQRERGISFHGFSTISLEIFVLKTSYAAYNLLKSVEAR